MNTELLRVIERQLLEVSGWLTIADNPEDIRLGHQRLIGVIHGLRIVIDGMETPEASQEKKYVQRS